MNKVENSPKSTRLSKLLIAFIVVFTAALYWTFNHRQANAEPLIIIGKGSSYETEWQRVDSLSSKGLYKSALDLSNQIVDRAKKENNNAQIVKGLIHRFKFSQMFQENSADFAIYNLQDELKTAKFPLAPVLHSMLADLYWSYYQTNRYQFYNRSQTVGFKNDSINSWDVNHLIDQTIKHYRLSLAQSDSLKGVSPDIYEAIITSGTASPELRPTLYDFLAWKAFNFYKGEEAAITRPVDKFVLDQPSYFAAAEKFSKLNISSTDTMSLKYYGLKVIQELVAFHLKDKNADALVDADLDRLIFVHAHSVLPEKDSLYESALRQLAANYPENPYTGEVLYYIAQYHNDLGNKYVAGKDEKYRLEKKRAVEMCERAIAKFPSTEGANMCTTLRNQILAKTLSFKTENTVVPDMPSRLLLTWTNISKVYVRIAHAEEGLKRRDDNRDQDEIITDYLKLTPVASWEQAIPDDGDYQTYNAEVKIPALAAGNYIILISHDKEFKMRGNAIAYGTMWSSSISYLDRQLKDGSYDYYIFDRQTGAPLEGVSSQLWIDKYDYSDRGYNYRKGDHYTSDKNGHIIIPPTTDYRNILLEFNWNKNRLYTAQIYQYKPYKYERKKEPKTFFFTDRSIYRPGQTVFFKGIVINTDENSNEIMPARNTSVTFYDANYQVVKTLELKTNEYGSVNGSFVVPSSGLTGQMRIANESGTVYFSVEEYKRPKFEVTTEPVKGAYRINDKIEVKGTAKTFAGSVVDGAEVKYRVVRSARFPWWWYSWRGYYPQSNSTEIANGSVISNDTGGYVIPFFALPDRSVPAESKPVFTYTLYIDVTDITGETHSTTAYVSVGYAALEMTLNVQPYIEKASNDSINIYLNNLSGEPEPAVVSYTIRKLNSPAQWIRDRSWSEPDKFLYKKEEWKSWFPDDPYADENDMTKWTKGETVSSGTINTEKLKKLGLKKSAWAPGNYLIEATTKDKYGVEVKDVRYFTLYDIKDKTPATKEAWSFQAIKTTCQPGENAVFLIGTSEKDVTVLYEIERADKIVETKWLKLSNEQKYIEIPVTEKDRGNFAVHFALIYHGRSFTSDQQVSVSWESQNLDITYETFRDKLLPGQKEEWKLKVKGPKGEKVAAEMVAAMYDASLDEFRGHSWDFYLYKSYYGQLNWQSGLGGTSYSNLYDEDWNPDGPYYTPRTYDQLNWFGYYYHANYYGYGGYDGDDLMMAPGAIRSREESAVVDETGAKNKPRSVVSYDSKVVESTTTLNATSATYAWTPADGGADKMEKDSENKDFRGGGKEGKTNLNEVKARSNLNETVFFFPQLETDSSGNVIIKFTMNEALTKWKFMAFAHTKDLKYQQVSREVVTQKDLMIMPNAPRFLRQGDHITITAKVSNLTTKELTGTAQLMLFNALTMEPIESKMLTSPAQLNFTAKKGQSAPLSWELLVPDGIDAVQYKMVAASGNFSDGEQNALPVLSNRMLVTETMPLPIRGGQTKEFRFEKLISQSNGSSTIRNQKLTLEFTANPAWYAVQALPYLMEYPYECAEQTFSRFYSNSIASNIANSSPKIKAVFDSWKNQSPDAFLSALEKNQDLKNVVLTETPWVLDAKDETDRKRRVGLLFDINRMADEQERTLRKMQQLQVSNGGWPWFEGMPDDRYITQYIITGMGHLDHLGIKTVRDDRRTWNMVEKGVKYLDHRIREDYDWILKHDKVNMEKDHLSSIAIQYLYARSFFKDVSMSAKDKEAFDYFFGQEKKYWTTQTRYMQGMIALAQFRYDEKKTDKTSNDVMKSLKETSLNSEELGMYWKENVAGYYWYQAPVETQALLIEAFKEVKNDTKSVDDMRVWLLKNKQTNDWKTTTATAQACYALLIDGTSWLATESDVSIVVGTQQIDPKKMDIKEEAGTGYFKTSWAGDAIKPEMGKVKVTKAGPGVSWGAMYWSYFEDIDKITPAQTPLKVEKQLFLVKNTASGPVITPITSETVLRPGDKVRVRVELRNDRDMEYIHMKDMRASGFEPVNVLSQYKYQDGLGYYESTKDASTDFFFSFLPKGVHVFEYPLTVIHAGDFSNGITQVQCMYAPEFSCHSAGTRVKVAGK
ncbi:MAG: MG2 domain-containing protein [Bacteroidota bacterium]|nr:MG2 domain-containing protein [Bacteroidota bacterium]